MNNSVCIKLYNLFLLKEVYYTIHVTPQVECSWVSFETNLELNSCIQLIKKVLAKFNPSKASVSLMTNKVSKYQVGECAWFPSDGVCSTISIHVTGMVEPHYPELQ